MQKHAYSVAFSPLPALNDETVYYDKFPVPLPEIENFCTLHYHDRYEIGICESGEGLFLFENEACYVREGDAVFFAPTSRHYSRSLHKNNPCLCRFVYIEKEAIEALLLFLLKDEEKVAHVLRGAKQLPSPVFSLSEHPKETVLLSELVRSCSETHPDLIYTAPLRLALFLIEMKEAFKPSRPHTESTYKTDAAVTSVAEYVSTHYEKNDTAADLARLCSLSESQLRRRFLRVYEMPPIAYRNRLRCKIAATLLSQSTMSVAEIAARIGYTDVSDFYRAFRKFYSVSPTAYRDTVMHTKNPPFFS